MLDAEVADGRAAGGSDVVRRGIARLPRDQRYRREESVLLDFARRGEILYPDLESSLNAQHPAFD